MHYLKEFTQAFSEGDLYPRWTAGTNENLGSPTFVMFPPLFYYAAGAASWLTGSVISGVKLYLIIASLLTAASFYLLARDWIGPGVPAAAASALYLLLPYHVLDVYQRFAMSETTAFIFFPLVLLTARRTLEGGGRWAFAGLSLSYAALLYTHLVSAFSFSLLLGIWLLWEARGRWRALLGVGVALACGIGLAAPSLLPAALESTHVNLNWVREMPNGDFRINFIFRDEILPALGVRDPVKPFVLRSAHSQLALAILATGIALVGLARNEGRRRGDVLVVMTGCAICYFLQLRISTPVWLIVPKLATVQFPWRFQTYMVLTTALLTGYAAGRLSGSGKRLAVTLGPLILVIAANLVFAWQNAFAKPFDFDAERLGMPGVVDWIEPAFTPVQFEGYRRLRFYRTEFPETGFVGGGGEVRVVERSSSRMLLEASSSAGGTVRVRSFWFPGWVGRIDGEPVDLVPERPHGLITFGIRPGTHSVELEFGPTPVRSAAAWIGLLSVLALAGAARWTRPPRTP